MAAEDQKVVVTMLSTSTVSAAHVSHVFVCCLSRLLALGGSERPVCIVATGSLETDERRSKAAVEEDLHQRELRRFQSKPPVASTFCAVLFDAPSLLLSYQRLNSCFGD